MHRLRRVSLILGVAYAAAGLAGCGGDSGTAPSGTPQVVEGTVNLPPLNLDAISFRINRGGVLSSRVDWNDPTNDIDTGLLPSGLRVRRLPFDVHRESNRDGCGRVCRGRCPRLRGQSQQAVTVHRTGDARRVHGRAVQSWTWSRHRVLSIRSELTALGTKPWESRMSDTALPTVKLHYQNAMLDSERWTAFTPRDDDTTGAGRVC